MHVTSKSGRVFSLPGPDEEASIRAGIASDPDTCELPDAAMKMLRPVGRPKANAVKQPVSIRLSPEVVAYFKATGKGWQTRMDEALMEYVEAHRQVL